MANATTPLTSNFSLCATLTNGLYSEADIFQRKGVFSADSWFRFSQLSGEFNFSGNFTDAKWRQQAGDVRVCDAVGQGEYYVGDSAEGQPITLQLNATRSPNGRVTMTVSAKDAEGDVLYAATNVAVLTAYEVTKLNVAPPPPPAPPASVAR